ncbi:MAG: PstA family ABC transporter permease, partial [Magnetospirillum sp.]
MTEAAIMENVATAAASSQAVAKRLKKRYAAERRFKALGFGAIALALGFLGILLVTIFSNGSTALVQTNIRLDVTFDAETLGVSPVNPSADELLRANYGGVIKSALSKAFPDVSGGQRRQLYKLVSTGADLPLRDKLMANPGLLGTTVSVWMTAGADVDMAMKGHVSRKPGVEGNRLTDAQLGWLDELEKRDAVTKKFNTTLFTTGDSREPEQAGLWGAVVGSFFSLSVTLLVCFPLGVATSVYLEEFAPKNKWTHLIEVNINNLAAVPSVVFGLLGLAIFLNFFGMPRSAPLVGGLVLALISMPTIIIAGRAAMKAVPPSIREAALGLGASKLQMVTDHVLPLSMPGILTGTILGMAHALGETAPLLMIG